jgi:hypothetical protein
VDGKPGVSGTVVHTSIVSGFGGFSTPAVPKAPLKAAVTNAKYLIVVTHLGHTMKQAQAEAKQIFSDDKKALYVYFLEGIGFDRNLVIISDKVDLNNVTELQKYFPGAY